MSDRKKGFTLIELLVVIAVIALLMAVIMPSLQKAKEMARRVICANHVRTLGTANEMYANRYEGAYVPGDWRLNNSSPSHFWIDNDVYRSFINIDDYNDSTVLTDFKTPKEFLCPSDSISRDPQNVSSQGVLTSYGFNLTDWGGFTGSPFYKGYKVADLRSPGNRLMFIDGIDFWVDWRAADYTIGWDLYGQQNIDFYKGTSPDSPVSPGIHGPVFYRHSEGADVGFYDSHVEYMKKEDIFIEDNYISDPQRPGMWAGNMTVFKQNN